MRFSEGGNTLEILTDMVASRTIWYTQTDDLFIASTSQRAIVFFLQSFELNQNFIPWMLSSGTLGPELTWDKRIRFLSPNTCLKLNRASWEIKTNREFTYYEPENISVKELANAYDIPHQYFETDISDETINKIFDRFLMAGEERVDHISGYMDGFYLWKKLRAKGYSGIIRGDHAFGGYAVKSSMNVYRKMHMEVLSDYENLQLLLRDMGFCKQTRPQNYEKRDNENLEEWRDCLVIEYKNRMRKLH